MFDNWEKYKEIVYPINPHVKKRETKYIIVCLNCENKREFGPKVWSAVEAIVDRVKYRRLDFEWKVCWGWLAHILENSQPFESYPLTKSQKRELGNYCWTNWENMRNTSYRTIEEMAEYLIEYPDSYEDNWASSFLRIKNEKTK